VIDNGNKPGKMLTDDEIMMLINERASLYGTPNVTAKWVLDEANETIKARGRKRDNDGERSMQRIVKVFHALTDHHMTETEGWMFMVVLKLCREKTGKDIDNWIDGAAYMALAAESVEKAKEG